MVTQSGVVDQKIDVEIALNQPITEALQFIMVAKVQGAAEQLQLRIKRSKLGFQRLQAFVPWPEASANFPGGGNRRRDWIAGLRFLPV
jgi:hypothetical protein